MDQPTTVPKSNENIDAKPTSTENSEAKPTRYRCATCQYNSKRKYTVEIHQKQHCKGLRMVIKNKICKICDKRYTHDGLRSHLRGLIGAFKTNRKVRGVHANYSVEQHEEYLDRIKLRDIRSKRQ